MSKPFFGTPADITDFTKPSSYKAWSDAMSDMSDSNISSPNPNNKSHLAYDYILANVKNPTLQYINMSKAPHNAIPAEQWADLPVEWNAFPKRISSTAPSPEQAAESDSCPSNDDPLNFFYRYYRRNPPLWPFTGRVADEYCEWFVKRDETGKITQVDFTAEGPEYWKFLYDHEPDTLVKLYNELSHPPAGYTITLEDLTLPKNQTVGNSRYNPNNLYNTVYGAVHLNCPPNSLGAEVNLGARATVMRKDGAGDPILIPEILCDCSQYGVATRNSDPTIGSGVNQLASQGFLLSIKNPIGLYIKSFNTLLISAPKGKPPLTQEQLSQIVVMTRGKKATPGVAGSLMGLRFTVSVPSSLNLDYTVGDLLVNHKPLNYGGDLAFSCVKIGLVGTGYQPNPPAQNPILFCRCVYEHTKPCDPSYIPPSSSHTSVGSSSGAAAAVANVAAAVTTFASDVKEEVTHLANEAKEEVTYLANEAKEALNLGEPQHYAEDAWLSTR